MSETTMHGRMRGIDSPRPHLEGKPHIADRSLSLLYSRWASVTRPSAYHTRSAGEQNLAIGARTVRCTLGPDAARQAGMPADGDLVEHSVLDDRVGEPGRQPGRKRQPTHVVRSAILEVPNSRWTPCSRTGKPARPAKSGRPLLQAIAGAPSLAMIEGEQPCHAR